MTCIFCKQSIEITYFLIFITFLVIEYWKYCLLSGCFFQFWLSASPGWCITSFLPSAQPICFSSDLKSVIRSKALILVSSFWNFMNSDSECILYNHNAHIKFCYWFPIPCSCGVTLMTINKKPWKWRISTKGFTIELAQHSKFDSFPAFPMTEPLSFSHPQNVSQFASQCIFANNLSLNVIHIGTFISHLVHTSNLLFFQIFHGPNSFGLSASSFIIVIFSLQEDTR